MSFKSYANHSGTLELSSTLRALLTETGEHVFRLAFEKEAELTRNFLFGVVLTDGHPDQSPENCGCDGSGTVNRRCLHETRRCVHVCYELCDSFPLCEGGAEHVRLQQTMQRVLGVRVRLLPFTQFERSIGYYPTLQHIFKAGEFSGVFRDEPGSPTDMKMHAVLGCWERRPFASPLAP